MKKREREQWRSRVGGKEGVRGGESKGRREE